MLEFRRKFTKSNTILRKCLIFYEIYQRIFSKIEATLDLPFLESGRPAVFAFLLYFECS